MLPNPLHPAVVHFPVVLAFLLPLFVGGALWAIRRGANARRAWLVPLAVAVALSLSAWAAVQTGGAQGERVERVVSEQAIESHEEMAEAFKDYPDALANTVRIAERCNVWEGRRRLHPADPPPRADALVNYVVPAGQPKFESDSGAGNSIHAYCVATAGVAVTLSAAIHADFKEVLRGVYAPAGSLARRNAAAAWARVGGDAGVQEITTVHERTAFDRQLG